MAKSDFDEVKQYSFKTNIMLDILRLEAVYKDGWMVRV